MTFALETKGLVKRYGKHPALNGLDLKIPTGCILGLVGSNGAGKTSLMSIAAGLVNKTSGEVSVLGEGDFSTTKHSGRVTISPQDSGLPYYARVGEILTFYARAQGMNKKEAARSLDQVLEWVNLSDRRNSTVRSLSHGMFRRLTVAQAFLGKPELIMLDEPMSGLDPKEVANMREVIRDCRGKQTIIVSSHILSEVEHICDEIAFVEKGQTVRQDKLERILRSDQHLRYTLGAKPALDSIEALAGLTAVWNEEVNMLDLEFDASTSPDAINAQVLPLLLEQQCPVFEIRRGSDLEREYLGSQ